MGKYSDIKYSKATGVSYALSDSVWKLILLFSFAFLYVNFDFAWLNCLYLDLWGFFVIYIIFLHPHPSEEGSDREAWWAPVAMTQLRLHLITWESQIFIV